MGFIMASSYTIMDEYCFHLLSSIKYKTSKSAQTKPIYVTNKIIKLRIKEKWRNRKKCHVKQVA